MSMNENANMNVNVNAGFKACDVLNYLINLSDKKAGQTVDTVKAGDGEKQVKKVAVCFIATPNVIRAAGDWGADLLVTHEPTYHDHYDAFDGSEIEAEKKALIESTGMAVVRFHDHAHTASPDLIHKGFLDTLGLRGKFDERRYFTLETPLTPLELAKLIEQKLCVKHVKIAGKRCFKATKLVLFLGACGDVSHLPLKSGQAEIAVCGETSEWKCGEFVRDASELGHNMAMLVLGHVGSERDGMKYIAEKLNNELGIKAAYFEAGEVYSYAD